MKPILPEVLRRLNQAAIDIPADSAAHFAYDAAIRGIAEVAARRIQIENRVRMIQASATRGSGMRRAALDDSLEAIIEDLRKL